MAGHPTPSGLREKRCSGCFWREWAEGGVAEGPKAHSQALWWQLKLLVPLATCFWCPLGLAGAPPTCFCSDLALETSRKGDGAQVGGKGTRLSPHAHVLARCLGHMKHNMADASQTLLMLLEVENTQCPGLGAWLTLLGQELEDGCGVCYPTTLDSTGFSPL